MRGGAEGQPELLSHTVPSYGLGSIKEVGVAGVSQDIPAPRVLIEVALSLNARRG